MRNCLALALALAPTRAQHPGPAFSRCPPRRWRWGFCAMRSPLAVCRRRVGGLDGAILPDRWSWICIWCWC